MFDALRSHLVMAPTALTASELCNVFFLLFGDTCCLLHASCTSAKDFHRLPNDAECSAIAQVANANVAARCKQCESFFCLDKQLKQIGLLKAVQQSIQAEHNLLVDKL